MKQMSMHLIILYGISIGLFGQLVALPTQSIVSKRLKVSYDTNMSNPLYKKGFAIVSNPILSKEYNAILSSINHFFVGYTTTMVKSLSDVTIKDTVVPVATVLQTITTQPIHSVHDSIGVLAHFAKVSPNHNQTQQQHTVEHKVSIVLQQIPPKKEQTKQQKRAQGLQTLLDVVSGKS